MPVVESFLVTCRWCNPHLVSVQFLLVMFLKLLMGSDVLIIVLYILNKVVVQEEVQDEKHVLFFCKRAEVCELRMRYRDLFEGMFKTLRVCSFEL
jgi:hypothetical protein